MSTFPAVVITKKPLRPTRTGIVIVCDGRTVARDGVAIILPKQQWLLASAVLVRSTHIVEYNELIDHVWGDNTDGGPLNTNIGLSVAKCRVNRLLSRLDLRLVCEFGRGLYAIDTRSHPLPLPRSSRQGTEPAVGLSRDEAAAGSFSFDFAPSLGSQAVRKSAPSSKGGALTSLPGTEADTGRATRFPDTREYRALSARTDATLPSNVNVSSFASSSAPIVCTSPMALKTMGDRANASKPEGQIVHARAR